VQKSVEVIGREDRDKEEEEEEEEEAGGGIMVPAGSKTKGRRKREGE